MAVPSGTIFKRFVGDTGSIGNDFIIGPNADVFDYEPDAWADYSIDGRGGNDRLIGGYGDDEVFGGSGNDRVSGNYGRNSLYGGDEFGDLGIDTLDYGYFGLNLVDPKANSGGINVSLASGDAFNIDPDLLVRDDFFGFENVNGSSFSDKIYGDSDANDLIGRSGNDFISAGSGADYVSGDNGHDKLYGGSGDDDIYGRNQNDTLFGNNGNDLLNGGANNDALVGGVGSDYLYGGSGADRFIYTSIVESTVSTSGRDVIKDFQEDIDVIDLRQVDATASTPSTDGIFDFIGRAAFTGLGTASEGELRYRLGSNGANYTVIEGDTTGDGTADFAITVAGRHSFIEDDFRL